VRDVTDAEGDEAEALVHRCLLHRPMWSR
jgi:hypothetical protein